jgi:hypothetical protein
MLVDAIGDDSIDMRISESIADYNKISTTRVEHLLEYIEVSTKERLFLDGCRLRGPAIYPRGFLPPSKEVLMRCVFWRSVAPSWTMLH